jgi:hypothetical protein
MCARKGTEGSNPSLSANLDPKTSTETEGSTAALAAANAAVGDPVEVALAEGVRALGEAMRRAPAEGLVALAERMAVVVGELDARRTAREAKAPARVVALHERRRGG